MEIIDTHCHLDIESHFPDFYEVVHRARRAGVGDMVLAGVQRRGWARLIEVCRRSEYLHAAPGLHPMYLDCHVEDDLLELQELVESEKVVAIGEIGLDFYAGSDSKEIQLRLFEAQLDIADRAGLPLILHVRKAHDQVLSTLRRIQFGRGGIVHAYNGSLQQAQEYIKLGFMVGVGGTVTNERATKIRKVAAALPLNSLVLETDSPDIPPVGHYGERNLPEYLPDILKSLTEIRSESEAAVAKQTTRNARAVLGLTR